MDRTVFPKIESVKDFSKKTVIIVPNSRTKKGIEKVLVNKHRLLSNTELLTLEEYIDDLTLDYRIENNIVFLNGIEAASLMLKTIRKCNKETSLFLPHQVDIDLARLLLLEYEKTAAHPNFHEVFYEQYKDALNSIYKEYQNELRQNNQWDKVSMYNHVIENEVKSDEEIYYFQIQQFLPIEKMVLKTFSAKSLELPKRKNEKKFYHTYGNKVGLDHFIKEIKDTPIDNVLILYTNEELVGQIETALSLHNIPATFSRGTSFTTTRLFSIIDALFNYVESEFLLLHLKDVLLNNEIGFAAVEKAFSTSTVKEVLGISGIDYGKRIPILVQKYIDENPKFEIEKVSELQNFTAFFNELHEKLEQLKNTTDYFDVFMEILEQFMNENDEALKKEVSMLMNYLKNMKVNAPSQKSFSQFKVFLLKELKAMKWKASGEKPEKLHVAYYEDQLVINRNTVAVFGMDSNSFPVLNTSSPFINEEVYEQLIKNETSYEELKLPTPLEQLNHSMKKLEDILSTVEGSIHLYANTYNTNRVRGQNESRFFKELRKGEKTQKVKYEIHQIQGEESTKQEGPVEKNYVISFDEKNEKGQFINILSPTSISTLLDCSRKYFFQKKMPVDTVEDLKDSLRDWLPANVRGNLIHDVFEAILNQKASSKDEFEKIANIIYEKYKREYEPIQQLQFDSEFNKMNQILDDFYNHLVSMKNEGWEVYGNEMVIPDDTVLTFEYEDGTILEICMTGRIDRIDKKEENGKSIYRTIDYKTGKKDNFNHIQLYLYNESLKKLLPNDEVDESQSAFYSTLDGDLTYFDMKKLAESKKDKKSVLETLKKKLKELDLSEVEFDLKSNVCKYCEYRLVCSGLEANRNVLENN